MLILLFFLLFFTIFLYSVRNTKLKISIAVFYLVFFLLFFSVIPIYKISNLPVSPENVLYILIVMFLITYWKIKNNNHVIIIIICYSSYHFLKYLIQFYLRGSEINLIFLYRDISLLLLFSMITNKKLYVKLLKSYSYILFFSMLFGLLIFFFGEPFDNLRIKIINNPTYIMYGYYTKGMRVVGFHPSIFSFAYPLSILPVLLFTFYTLEKKWFILIMLFVSIIGVILNGERTTFLFSLVVIVILFRKWYKGSKKIIYIITIIIFGFLMQNFLTNYIKSEHSVDRLVTSRKEEVYWRLTKQYAGFLSVLKHPITGAETEEYEALVYSWTGLTPSYVHNTYVNVGMHAGLLGWLLLIIFFIYTKKIINIFKSKSFSYPDLTILFQGVVGAFLSVLAVGFFHNAGIFTSERSTFILLGFLIAGSSLRFKKNIDLTKTI